MAIPGFFPVSERALVWDHPAAPTGSDAGMGDATQTRAEANSDLSMNKDFGDLRSRRLQPPDKFRRLGFQARTVSRERSCRGQNRRGCFSGLAGDA